MVTTILLTFIYFIMGASCVYGGLALINGQLFPTFLGWYYEAVQNSFWRTLIASITIFMGANYFNAKGYIIGGQALGGPLYILVMILGMIVSALLINKTSLNWHIIGGAMVLCLGALWVVHGLSQTS